MSNTATVIIGGDATKFESVVERSKKTVREFTAQVEKEAMKSALAMENAVRQSKLKTQAAEARSGGDNVKAAAIEREIALQSELASIRKMGGTAEQRQALELQAIRRKELADEEAILNVERQRRAELQNINAIAAKSAMERQKMLNNMSIAPGAGPGAAGGKGRSYAIGGVAMQLQDVAVQAQMGTAVSTIVAQQGSQMLSAFGPAGMIVGGVVALCGALVTLGLESQKAFEQLIEGADDSQAALGAVIASGSISAIVSELEKSGAKMRELAKNSADLDTMWGGFKARLGAMTGGDNSDQQQRKIAAEMADQRAMDLAAQQRALQLSAEEVQIARLKLEGRDREAAALERQIALQKELAAIDRKQIDRSTKFQLGEDAKAKSGLEGEAENKKFDEENARKAQAFIDDIDKDLEDARKKRQAAEEKTIKEIRDFEEKQRDEFRKSEEQKEKNAQAQEAKRAQEAAQASDDMVSAQAALAAAQEKRLTLTERTANASKRVMEAEQQLERAKGTGAGEYKAQAELARARGQLQELALERAGQFVGRSSKDVREMERDDEKKRKEFEKAKRRSVEAAVREADQAARRGDRENGFRTTGLTEAQKAQIRARERKAQGQDLKENAQADAAKSLKSIENDIKKVVETLDKA